MVPPPARTRQQGVLVLLLLCVLGASFAEPTRFISTYDLAAVTLSRGGVRIEVPAGTVHDAHAVLAVVLPELEVVMHALPATTVVTAEVEFVLAPAWRASPAGSATSEQCVRVRELGAFGLLRVRVTCGGLLGLAYAMHDLREALALSGPDSTGPVSAVTAAVVAFGAGSRSPAFGVRAWSEEGTLLALPDRGYYMPDGGAADTTAIAGEAAALEAEIVPALLRLRMNTLIVLHSDVEDYVTYDSLPTFLPGAPPVYPANATHRVRRAGIVGTMAPWIAHLAADFGIAFYLQVYELSSPPGVCTPPAVVDTGLTATGPLFNCSLDSPATRALLRAKYSELRAALPALAGIFVTVEDSWTPRAGYEFTVLWSGQEQLPTVVSLFHDAVVVTAGLQMRFRLWLFGQPVDWPSLRNGTPADTSFSVKVTNGDFLLDYPINALLQCGGNASADCAPRDRRLIIEVDAFRQYNGWTSGVCFMGEQWAPRLAAARAAAAGTPIDVWGWGSWAPGCTWPDSGPTLLNATYGSYKSWRSWWAPYRLFNGTATNAGFSLGGQANAYLLYRLAWADAAAPPPSAAQVAADFGALYYGSANAAPIAALLNASLHAWLPTSSPSGVGDFTLFWTLMQKGSPAFAKLAPTYTRAEFDSAARASAAAVADMEAALAAVNPAAVPTPHAYDGAVRAVAVSRGYLAAAFAWRAAGLVVAQLGAKPDTAACVDARGAITDLDAATAAFGAAFPIEAASWVVATLDAALYSYPPFLASDERTMAAFVPRWAAAVAAVCT